MSSAVFLAVLLMASPAWATHRGWIIDHVDYDRHAGQGVDAEGHLLNVDQQTGRAGAFTAIAFGIIANLVIFLFLTSDAPGRAWWRR